MAERLPEPPAMGDMEPASMTAKELRQAAERLWSWLEKAQSANETTNSEERSIDRVTAAFNEITRERRRRHREEFPMRGS